MRVLTSLITALVISGCATSTQVRKPDQKALANAAMFLPESLNGKVSNMRLKPNWISGTNDFWFESEDTGGEQTFWLVKGDTHKKSPLVIKDKLELALSKHNYGELNWQTSPLTSVKYLGQTLSFSIGESAFRCDLSKQDYICELFLAEQTDKPKYLSPNQTSYVKLENYNLVLCQLPNKECKKLTQDGTEQAPYAVKHPYPEMMLNDRSFDPQSHLDVHWSPGGRYAMTYRLHRKGVNKLTLVDSVADNDFSITSTDYYYPQAGDVHLPAVELVLIDSQNLTVSKINTPFVMQTYYGGALWGYWQGDRYYYHDRRRGNREYYLRTVDATTGRVANLVKDTDDEFIDPWVKTFRLLTQSNRLIWTSQRSGYQHLYLYNKSSGELINPITSGDFTVRVIRGVDEEKGVVYFEASGYDKTIDPYLRQLFRVNLDGSGLTLLTPEVYEHDTRLSPDFSYFVDTYSDHRTPPVSVMRDTETGQVLTVLQEADVDNLMELGWQPPETFSVLADDGKTPLYGLIYKPSNFDANKRYAIINDTYTGPHNFFTPKSFNTFSNQRSALAELGFIVVKMDGRGTSKRGKAFHRHSYKNLAAGTDDHVRAITQLAKERPYMDVNRVGIFGFSAGGYDVVQAMMRHPDFFKVGVSASGNHEFKVDKAGWNEIWMGWPVSKEWHQQSNLYRVNRLKGKLLLGHGELDSNVHPSATMRLVAELIKADKDFEMLIMPKMGHVLDEHPYWVKKRWKFFIEHLMLQ